MSLPAYVAFFTTWFIVLLFLFQKGQCLNFKMKWMVCYVMLYMTLYFELKNELTLNNLYIKFYIFFYFPDIQVGITRL